MTARTLVIFSDLDGTLLDHDTYRFDAARPALALLAQHRIPLILNSSKTRAEIASLRTTLDNTHPYIIENGAAVIIPAGYFGQVDEQQILFSPLLQTIRHCLNDLRTQAHFQFVGFQDMSVAELAGHTGLSPDDAQRAMQRIGTEPLLWQDSEENLQRFQHHLTTLNLQMIRGGRFIHVMGQFDKADAMHYLVARFKETLPATEILTIALGDSPNDCKMLQSADYAIVIKGIHSDAIHLNKSAGREMRSRAPGPEGWNQCLLTLIPSLLSPSVITAK